MGSTRMHVLQFGATGQVGRALMRASTSRSHVTHRVLARADADFRDPQVAANIVRAAKGIDVVINAAAFTAVDRAEREEDLACTVNARAVSALAEVCAERNVPLIHLSTDYVFDGLKLTPYVEDDLPNPINAYGRTKLEGEEAVRRAGGEHVILRSSWVYGSDGHNFLTTMLGLGAREKSVRVVDDQHGTPTAAASVAAAVFAIVDAIFHTRDVGQFGTFHFTDLGETTWCGFARAIFSTAGLDAAVVPISHLDYRAPAKRPANSRLDCARFDRVFAHPRRHWCEVLSEVAAGIGEGLR